MIFTVCDWSLGEHNTALTVLTMPLSAGHNTESDYWVDELVFAQSGVTGRNLRVLQLLLAVAAACSLNYLPQILRNGEMFILSAAVLV